MMSIIIPSANDPCLQKTVTDIRRNARGEIEIIVVLDGTMYFVDGVDDVLFNEKRQGMRTSINQGVAASNGEYIMKVDAHCAFDDGFDVKLLSRIEDNWIVVPKRYSLDIDNWKVIGEPIEYERIAVRNEKIGGTRWKRKGRDHIKVDETMTYQGSCYLMSRKHWDNTIVELQNEGYGNLMQEAIETCLKTWLSGGKVMVNKNTWYAHRDRKYKRTFRNKPGETEKCYEYSKDFWLNNRWEKRKYDFNWLMERFRS